MPEVILRSPHRASMMVVFPEPDGPMSEVREEVGISMFMFSREKVPEWTVRFLIRSMMGILFRLGEADD